MMNCNFAQRLVILDIPLPALQKNEPPKELTPRTRDLLTNWVFILAGNTDYNGLKGP